MACPLVQLFFWVESKGEKLPVASEHYDGASCCTACVLRHARRSARRSVSQEATTGAGTAAASLGFRPAKVLCFMSLDFFLRAFLAAVATRRVAATKELL